MLRIICGLVSTWVSGKVSGRGASWQACSSWVWLAGGLGVTAVVGVSSCDKLCRLICRASGASLVAPDSSDGSWLGQVGAPCFRFQGPLSSRSPETKLSSRRRLGVASEAGWVAGLACFLLCSLPWVLASASTMKEDLGWITSYYCSNIWGGGLSKI